MKSKIALAALCLALGGVLRQASANAVFPAGNFTVYGTVKSWGGDLFRVADGVTVMAVNTNGVVIASTKLHAPVECANPESGDLRNYLLTVPLSTAATGKTAVEGEPLSLVIVSDTSTYRTTDPRAIVVTGAGEKRAVNVELATDDDGDGVADQYVAELHADMYGYGYDTYDKDADWDEDGKSNFEEYLAGTNPFDANDRFVLTAFSANGIDGPGPTDVFTWPVSFYAKSGRSYTIVGAGSLETNAVGNVGWTNETFAVGSHERNAYTALEDDRIDGDGTTFYLMPAGDRHFWKVLIEASSQGAVIEKIGEK